MPCRIDKITLTYDPNGSPVAFSAELTGHPSGTPLCSIIRENRLTTPGRTIVGRLRGVGGGRRPTLRHEVQAYCDEDTWAKINRMLVYQESEPQTVCTLKNEANYLDTVEGGWHTRSLVTDSTITTTSGLTLAFYSYPVFIRVEEPWYRVLGGNKYAVTLTLLERI